MKKRILLLSTGGTIASQPSEDGLIPAIDGKRIFQLMGGMNEIYDVDAEDILHLDSSNIQPEEWQLIARSIYRAYQKYDGIVVTHGTDTMAYTSAMLSFMLQNIPVPVVITGSQLPLLHPLTDAMENLRCAFAMAVTGIGGVFLAFDHKIILGTRAVKVRTTGFDAFESVNSPCVATVDAGGLKINREILPKIQGGCVLKDNLDNQVFLIKLTPGLNPQIFDMLLNMNYKGIIIEAFGAGGLHFIHRDLISKLQTIVDSGISVVVCSQCLYERSDFSIYQTGKMVLEKGVIPSYDMTTEAAVTKLMWCLGQTADSAEIRRLFATNFVGEIIL